MDDAIENIDIGGPAMVRAAAKNHAFVAIVTDPADYPELARQLAAGGGKLGFADRYALAAKAFSHTAEYDGMISSWLTARDARGAAREFPDRLNLQFTLAQRLRYGENPHQSAAFYAERDAAPGTLSRFTQLQGKELSYNNIADADAAWECCRTFDVPACVIVKHANPCGVAIAQSPLEAYRRAFVTDPTSAFGGIIAFNRAGRRAHGRGRLEAVRRGGDRAGLRGGGEEGASRPSRTCACSTIEVGEGPEPPRHEARGRRAAGADPGRLRRGGAALRHEDGSPPRPR